MLTLLNRARNKRDNGEDGFTLIELLVVVVILGILIAIAIPVYLNYRKSANDKASQSDLRNAISTFEVCNSDNGFYPGSVGGTGTIGGTPACSQTVSTSTGTTLTYFGNVGTASNTGYVIQATNSGGSTKVYCYASAVGGSVKQQTTTTVLTAFGACPS